MTIQPTEPERPSCRPRRFQYTLRALLGLTTAVAMACAIFFAAPPWVSVLVAVCVIVSTPALLTVTLVYGRGYTRTFCIGALFPAGICLSPLASSYALQLVGAALDEVNVEFNVAALVFVNAYFGLVLGNGLLALYVRHLVEAAQRGRARQSRALDDGPRTGRGAANLEKTSGEER